jgi:hypothetical protein
LRERVEGLIDGESFTAYVEKILLPTLQPGDIVILDNLGSQRAKSFLGSSARSAPSFSSCRNTRPT